MRIWYLIAGLLLAPFLGMAQDIPFFRNNRATNAENVPYTPTDGAHWTNPDPDDVEDALDKVADRVTALEASVPAAEVTYPPAVLADWDGAADPGNVDDALDQLAERTTDQADVGGITYTPAVVADWDGAADPGDADAALDQLGERVADVEVAGGIGYTPAVATDWDADADPGNVDDALDQLAERVDDNELAIIANTDGLISIRKVTASVGAEAANVITLTINVLDSANANVADGARLELGLFTDAFFQSVSTAGNFAVADAGDGSIEASDGGNNRHILLTGGASRVQLTVTDVATGSGTTLYCLVRLLGDGSTAVASSPIRVLVTFDGV